MKDGDVSQTFIYLVSNIFVLVVGKMSFRLHRYLYEFIVFYLFPLQLRIPQEQRHSELLSHTSLSQVHLFHKYQGTVHFCPYKQIHSRIYFLPQCYFRKEHTKAKQRRSEIMYLSKHTFLRIATSGFSFCNLEAWIFLLWLLPVIIRLNLN